MPFLSSLLLNQQQQDGHDVQLGQEIPVTSTPIFEGHLSVRTEKKHWQWRLFRFNGSNFTCLSTRKVKKRSTNLNISPLLSTPKDKTKRLILAEDEQQREDIKYYQLPEWTIDVLNISSISVLKRGTSTTKCFSIRTFFGHCVILKAQKQKDLERWLFVLTKMWKFTQAVRLSSNHGSSQQHQQSSNCNQQQQQPYYFNQQQQQQQLMVTEQDNVPLVHSIQQQQQEQEQEQEPILLSDEKIRVIEEWRRSLAELMANDPNIKRISTTPPPIEPIPDDDTMSVFTDMTSVSNRQQTKSSSRKRSASTATKRNKINSVSPISATTNNNAEILPLRDRQVPTLRKKRSDDVRNWMNSSSSKTNGLNRKPSNRYVLPTPISATNYYQQQQQQQLQLQRKDGGGSIVTTTSPEIYSNNINNCPGDDDGDILLKYHTSNKGKNFIIQGQQQQQQGGTLDDKVTITPEEEREKENNRREPNVEEEERGGRREEQQMAAVKEEEKEGVQINSNINDDAASSNQYNKRRTIIRRSSMPLTDNNLLLQQQQFLLDNQQYQQQQVLQQFPLEQLFYNKKEEEEEDMSLADLQKSLRKVKLKNQRKRSPSASSIHDLQRQYYYQQQQPSIITAPGIPPLQVQQQYLFDTTTMAAYYQQHCQFQQQQQKQFGVATENSSSGAKRASFLSKNNYSNIYNR